MSKAESILACDEGILRRGGAGSGTFSQLSVFSLLFSVVLGLDSRLAKDALESAWFTVEIAIDENAANTSHSTHMVMRRMSTNRNYNDGAESLIVEAETELQNRIWGRHGSHTTFKTLQQWPRWI